MSSFVEDHVDFLIHRRPRRRFVGSAGVLGALAGAYLAGRVMVWLGWFTPGVTPDSEILNYWPGFLAGLSLGGLGCAFLARLIWGSLAQYFE